MSLHTLIFKWLKLSNFSFMSKFPEELPSGDALPIVYTVLMLRRENWGLRV